MLAGAQGVFAEIRARTVRLPQLPAPQGDAITFSRYLTGQDIIRPQGVRIQ